MWCFHQLVRPPIGRSTMTLSNQLVEQPIGDSGDNELHQLVYEPKFRAILHACARNFRTGTPTAKK